MRHRHLVDGAGWSKSVIDDVLDRGSLEDWIELREAAKADRAVAEAIVDVCRGHYMYGTSALWLEMMKKMHGIEP